MAEKNKVGQTRRYSTTQKLEQALRAGDTHGDTKVARHPAKLVARRKTCRGKYEGEQSGPSDGLETARGERLMMRECAAGLRSRASVSVQVEMNKDR